MATDNVTSSHSNMATDNAISSHSNMATDHVHPGTDEIQPVTEHHSAKGKGHALPAKVHKNPAADHVHLVTDEIPAATEHHVAKAKIHARPAKGKGPARPAKVHRNPATDEIQPATDHVHGGASDGPHPGRLWIAGSKSPWTPKKDKKDQGYPAWRHEDAPPPRDPVSLTVIRGIEKCHEKIYNFLDFRHMLRGPDITTFDMFSHISKLRISYPTHGFIERRTIPYYCVKNEIPTFHMYQLDRRQTYLIVVVDKAAQNYVGPCLAWLQLGYHWRQESDSWEELETKDPTPVTFPKGKINPPTGWLSFKKNHMYVALIYKQPPGCNEEQLMPIIPKGFGRRKRWSISAMEQRGNLGGQLVATTWFKVER